GSPRSRWCPASSVAPVPLLAPWVSVVVVAQPLPEAGFVGLQELDPPDPLGALPEVEVRYKEARRAAVLGLQLVAVVAGGDPGLAVGDVGDGQVGRIAAVGEGHAMGGVELEAVEERIEAHALPAHVELGPLGH